MSIPTASFLDVGRSLFSLQHATKEPKSPGLVYTSDSSSYSINTSSTSTSSTTAGRDNDNDNDNDDGSMKTAGRVQASDKVAGATADGRARLAWLVAVGVLATASTFALNVVVKRGRAWLRTVSGAPSTAYLYGSINE